MEGGWKLGFVAVRRVGDREEEEEEAHCGEEEEKGGELGRPS